jgi:protein O-GlcNAc transferase
MSLLPIIYPDQSSIQIYRNRYREELIKLRETVSLTTQQDIEAAAEAIGSRQPFFLACQGINNRELQKLYGDLVCRIMALRYPQFAKRPTMPPILPGEPLRIGFISGYFYHHSVWKIPLKGWVENLNRQRFNLYGYYTRRRKDYVTADARKCFGRFVEDINSFEELCSIIRGDDLHILIYPEIGMDPLSLKLAALRLSPIQCTSLGHPDTSGLSTIDYYLSSDLMEPPDADTHYTERLIRLPNLSFYYMPLDVTSAIVTRDTFNLRPKSILYLCSHALFTYLPQYDNVFPSIAKQVGDCQFLFISSHKSAVLTEQFNLRINRVFNSFGMNASDHVVFLPPLDPGRYHAINCLADIFLDSIGWSANNSTFEALTCNLPVVTFPGSLMRQRHCSAILTMMGLTETIAASPDEYVALAVKLGQNSGFRRQISEKIVKTKHLVYRDRTCITALEDFLERAVAVQK